MEYDYERWLGSLSSDPAVLGGELVFPGTRVSVRNVGELVLRGVRASDLLEDYPDLTERDVACAARYAEDCRRSRST